MVTHPLKSFRTQKRLTQLELAGLLDVARTTVARWETGRRIDETLLPRVAERTGIAPYVLRPDLARLLAGETA